MRFVNTQTDQAWALFPSMVVLLSSIPLVTTTPLNPIKQKTALSTTAYTPTPVQDFQTYLYSSMKNTTRTGTPVKAEPAILRRTNTPSDEDDDDGSDIPDDEHPYGPDDHPPLTVFDFFATGSLRIECHPANWVLSLRPHSNNVYLPASQWPQWRSKRGFANQAAMVMGWQDKCRNCRCSYQGAIVPNPDPHSQRHIHFQRRCDTVLIAETCRTAAGCFCTANLIHPTHIPVGITDAEIQDTMDEIPVGIKNKNRDFIYTHGDGREFRFSPFELDPAYIIEHLLKGDPPPADNELDWEDQIAQRNAYSGALPYKISNSGNRQYLVPGTKEPYYLEGPDPEAKGGRNYWSGYNADDILFLNTGRNSKRDISLEKSDLGLSAWDKGQVLGKDPKDQVSPATKGHSAPQAGAMEPTKTIKHNYGGSNWSRPKTPRRR
ncbi:hypothetical protein TWF718_011120 [Orbilia javanica]|uniref:Uncharacterized protein n=1 Tax=Orbilia javanica TaxID=47235 RepID=A0AAN8RKE9_9PEZI